jgi:hypothetical protein
MPGWSTYACTGWPRKGCRFSSKACYKWIGLRRDSAAALQAGCASLLTDYLQHGQVLEKALHVVNPLREPAGYPRSR